MKYQINLVHNYIRSAMKVRNTDQKRPVKLRKTPTTILKIPELPPRLTDEFGQATY